MRGVTFSEFGGGKNVDMFVQAPIAKPQSPMIEAINTAKKIRNTFSKDLYEALLVFTSALAGKSRYFKYLQQGVEDI